MVNNKFHTPHILRPVHDSSINQKTLVLQRVLIVDVDISKLLRDCNVENFTSSNKQAAQACTLSTLSREKPPLCPLLEILSGLSGQADLTQLLGFFRGRFRVLRGLLGLGLI